MTERLLVRSAVPTDEAFRSAVGGAAAAWTQLTERVSVGMAARPIPSWGGATTGWEVRHRRAGRPFVTLTPGVDSFRACVVLGRAERDLAEAAPLSPAAAALLAGARRFPDGTWLFITVRTTDDVAVVLEFLELKLPDRLRRALGAPAAR